MTGCIVVAAIVLVSGLVAQFVCSRHDRRRYPATGRLLEGLHVHESGTREGLVVCEAGLAATSLNWYRVQEAVTSQVRTVSYDRQGLGWSPSVSGDLTLRRWTDDLHRLIHALDAPLPVVLVGHSFGTFIVRAYAHRFPGEVAALVLVDPVMPEEFCPLSGRTRMRLWRAAFFADVTSVCAACGLVRLGLWGLLRRGGGHAGPVLGLSSTLRRIAGEVAKLPPAVIPPLRAHWSRARLFRQLAASIRALPRCAREVMEGSLPAGLPVVVLSGSHQPPETLRAHQAIATRHIVVDGSAHWIHLDRPALVADAILTALRAGGVRS